MGNWYQFTHDYGIYRIGDTMIIDYGTLTIDHRIINDYAVIWYYDIDFAIINPPTNIKYPQETMVDEDTYFGTIEWGCFP